MSGVKRFLAPLVVVALVIAGAVWMFGGGSDQKTLTAYFPRTLSLYEGSDVRVLGVPVGTIETVTPEGTRVRVTMSYDAEVDIPSDAEAVIVSPAIVGDRYVQLTPAYESGQETMADGTVLDEGRTAVPLELDDIYSSIDELTVAVGPNGANSEGALTDLLEQTAKNFDGQGAKFNQTIKDFSQLSQTLDDNKEELFGSAAELQKFISTLAENDTTVRQFNSSLGQVSTALSGEREELAAALSNLSTALGEVGTFVQENRDVLGRNISGLNRVSKVLVNQRDSLEEILRVAPVALNNLGLTYNPDAGTLDTNANLGTLGEKIESNPALVVCAALAANDPDGALCDLFEQLLPAPDNDRGGGGGGGGEARRTQPFGPGAGPGTGSSIGAAYDPSLNGLVEVSR